MEVMAIAKATLNELPVDGDDYIRFKITRSFDGIIQSLCETHKKE
jgi:hypothetical protein